METGGSKQLYEFGPFLVDPEKRLLSRRGTLVPLAPKTFETLLVLIRHSQEVVSKDDLMKNVWPDTFVEETNLSRNIFLLRKALGKTAEDHHYIVTQPGRGYRFTEPVRTIAANASSVVLETHSRSELIFEERTTNPQSWIGLAVLALVAVVALGAFQWHRSHEAIGGRHALLGSSDSVLIADFSNTTGDRIFDNTLKEAASVQLAQSPFLNVLSDETIRDTLKLMAHSPGERLTADIAREVCLRCGGKAYLIGSIASLGSEYVIGLKAVNCRTGDPLVKEQVTADRKESVLRALDKAATDLRRKVGESLGSIKKFDTPIEQATTPSLEALQAYSLGRKAMVVNDDYVTAVLLFKRAISFDPVFAMAYASLGTDYAAIGEPSLGIENVRKAYDLRDRVSEREKLYIESHYYQYALGDLEKAREVYDIFARIYPRDWVAPENLGVIYTELGQYENALAENQGLVNMAPGSGIPYGVVVRSYILLNRLKGARAAADEALAKNLDSALLHLDLYQLAFLEKNSAAMSQQVDWAAGKPTLEAFLLGAQANTDAYFGRLKESRELSRRAVASAERFKASENAANYEAEAALRESLFGNTVAARKHATAALDLSKGREVQYEAALAFALTGAQARARSLGDSLAKQFPDDTIVRFNYLPALYAQLALNRGDIPRALKALQDFGPYELGQPTTYIFGPALCPVFIRGEAYLAAHRLQRSVIEFDKILDHPGMTLNEPVGPLARLGLARAYALRGDNEKSLTAYRDFFKLWKDADPDIPVLKEAKTEYENLQERAR